ncbi:glycosyltransferase [Lactococcus fujiensis]|uniref:glycosyltransferase n=1 Tax=Lactococcus fujiensis TaxID=610251 RepID=UPI000AC27CDA|nr:glycosyltransferase [Lactococcus fujiensis]
MHFFNGFYVPHLGGVERYTYNIAKKLLEKGYNVIIVTTQHDDQLKKRGNLRRYQSLPLTD